MIPPEADAAFVCAMEDVMEVYARPYDPRRPQVCLDECSKRLVAETRVPLPAGPGRAERYEYERRGTANLFIVPSCQPGSTTSRSRIGGRRWV